MKIRHSCDESNVVTIVIVADIYNYVQSLLHETFFLHHLPKLFMRSCFLQCSLQNCERVLHPAIPRYACPPSLLAQGLIEWKNKFERWGWHATLFFLNFYMYFTSAPASVSVSLSRVTGPATYHPIGQTSPKPQKLWVTWRLLCSCGRCSIG